MIRIDSAFLYFLTKQKMTKIKSTTVIAIKHNGEVAIGADGQATMGNTVAKSNVKKIRKLQDGKVVTGFAGSTADAFTLLERLESKLDEYPGQLARSCVELAKGWRTDKYLRRLEASLLVADKKASFEITGNGDVLESHDGVSYLFLTWLFSQRYIVSYGCIH